jgi:hypothetical protein
MQFHQTIKLSAVGIAAIVSNNAERLRIITDELEANLSHISSLLTSYHWSEKGIVHALKIDPLSIRIDQSGKGSFITNYGTNIHYGCSDVDIELENKMRINLSVDLQTGETILTGEYIPEREPDSF